MAVAKWRQRFVGIGKNPSCKAFDLINQVQHSCKLLGSRKWIWCEESWWLLAGGTPYSACCHQNGRQLYYFRRFLLLNLRIETKEGNPVTDRNEIIKTQARRAATLTSTTRRRSTTHNIWSLGQTILVVDLSSRVSHSSAMIHALVNHPKFL